MILSASRRTDIPTFYSEWFFNRIKAVFLYVRNPMNAHQINGIDLSPEVVDCIVFWTKNPIPILPRLSELDAYKCIDKKLIEEIIGCDIKVSKDKSQRLECGCMESVEIGSYNTCLNGCKYCYANYSPDAVKASAV